MSIIEGPTTYCPKTNIFRVGKKTVSGSAIAYAVVGPRGRVALREEPALELSATRVWIDRRNGMHRLEGSTVDFAARIVPIEIREQSSIAVEASALQQALKRIDFARGRTDLQPSINCYYLEASDLGLRAVAIDRYRMAVTTIDTEIPYSGPKVGAAFHPLSTVMELALNTGVIDIDLGDDFLALNGEPIAVVPKFPNWERFIPFVGTEYGKANCAQLLEALEGCRALQFSRFRTVTLEAQVGTLTLSFGRATSSIDFSYSGHPFMAVYNVDSLIEAVKAVKGSSVQLGLCAPSIPLIIKSPELLSILMPSIK